MHVQPWVLAAGGAILVGGGIYLLKDRLGGAAYVSAVTRPVVTAPAQANSTAQKINAYANAATAGAGAAKTIAGLFNV